MSMQPRRHLVLKKYTEYIARNLAMAVSLAVDRPAKHFYPHHIMRDRVEYDATHACVRCYINHQKVYTFECNYTVAKWWEVSYYEYRIAAYSLLAYAQPTPQICMDLEDFDAAIAMTYRLVKSYRHPGYPLIC